MTERATATARLLAAETWAAARRLLKAPRFLFVGVLTIAAATAPSLIFSLVDAAVLPKLPFEDVDRLFVVRDEGGTSSSYPKISYLAEQSKALEVAATTGQVFFLEQGDTRSGVGGAAVTPNYFDVMRIRPVLGRSFNRDENLRPFAHAVAIVSESLWKARFGEDPGIVGRQIRLSGEGYTVVGVMPAVTYNFHGFERAIDLWVPAMMSPRGMLSKEWRESTAAVEHPYAVIWNGIARLRPGHSREEAQAEADSIGRGALSRWPKRPGRPFRLLSLAEEALDTKVVRAVSLLKVAGALVLLLGAINLGGLALSRGLTRSAALSVHTILGAPRAVLLWGVVAESLIVGVLGSFVAFGLTRLTLAFLAWVEPGILSAPFGVTFNPAAFHLHPRLLLGGLGLATLAALMTGAAVAWHLLDPRRSTFWRTGSGAIAGGLRSLRITRPIGALIAVQMAAALTLTHPALLLTRSLKNLITADLGFQPDQLLVMPLDLPISEYSDDRGPRLIDDILEDLRRSPAVERAAWSACVPINCGRAMSLEVKRGPSDESPFPAIVIPISANAVEALGLKRRSGRTIDGSDGAQAERVVLISELTAARLGNNALGSSILVQGGARRVVGVVGDVSYHDLASKPFPVVYLPQTQSPLLNGMLVIRSSKNAAEVSTAVRAAIAGHDSRLEVVAMTPEKDRIDRDLARFRGAAWLLGAAACISLLLTGMGTFGLLSTVVARALPEIGVRMALGASPTRILGAVSGAAALLATTGLVAGFAAGSFGARLIEPYVFGAKPFDGPGAFLLLVSAAVLALLSAILPARRASRVDPVAVLRAE